MSISMSYRRRHENVGTLVAAKLPLIGADGVVVSSYRLSTPTVLISGGLKQLPRLRQQGRRTFSLWRSHPFFAKKGNTPAQTVCSILDSSACTRRGASLAEKRLLDDGFHEPYDAFLKEICPCPFDAEIF